MEIPARYKSKNKKPAPKSKTSKKRKSDGLRQLSYERQTRVRGNGKMSPTCSMFLAEITRKLASKKKQEEESKNIIQTIIESITNALPVKISKRFTPEKKDSPMKIETLQTFAPELLPIDLLNIPPNSTSHDEEEIAVEEVETSSQKPPAFKMPKMPLVSSEVLKMAVLERKKKVVTQDTAVNTVEERDVASEIAKHVNTLRKISLIAEELNQKTAKNLKEIVDSVQEDLIKKLEEIQAEQRAKTSKEEKMDTDD